MGSIYDSPRPRTRSGRAAHSSRGECPSRLAQTRGARREIRKHLQVFDHSMTNASGDQGRHLRGGGVIRPNAAALPPSPSPPLVARAPYPRPLSVCLCLFPVPALPPSPSLPPRPPSPLLTPPPLLCPLYHVHHALVRVFNTALHTVALALTEGGGGPFQLAFFNSRNFLSVSLWLFYFITRCHHH